MPYISKERRQQGGYAQGPRRGGMRLPYDDYPPIPMPDQSRYGPPGTTDSPRYWGDGVTRRPDKGDEK